MPIVDAVRPWKADRELSPEEAGQRIRRQFPLLAPLQIEILGVGWDNAAFLVNGAFVFRFPRRKIAAALIANESRILPRLAPHLPLPVPVPLFVGAPDADYPYPFAGYRFLPGTTACRTVLLSDQRAQNAAPLGAFLAALHRIPADDPDGPLDEIDRADLAKRAPQVKERLRALTPAPAGIDVGALVALIDRLAATPARAEPPCWVHGDLYARHLLVDQEARLCGVIDWGDVHRGDPALDLSIAFSFLPPDARETFRQAYGPIDAATWDRARFRAIHYGAILTSYGAEIGDEAIRMAGEYALRMC